MFDSATHEHMPVGCGRVLIDDFEGETLNTNLWLANDLNLATQTVHDGFLDLLLTNENNPQEAGCGAAGNSLDWDISKGLIIEFRAALIVLPTGEAEIHLGVLGEAIVDQQQISSADDVAEHAVFSFDGAGLCKINTDDGTNETTAVTTGITVVAGVYHIFRIDFTDDANVIFYIDGVQVIPGTTVMMDDIASPLVQPAMIAQKNANTGVGNLAVDYIKIWQPTR